MGSLGLLLTVSGSSELRHSLWSSTFPEGCACPPAVNGNYETTKKTTVGREPPSRAPSRLGGKAPKAAPGGRSALPCGRAPRKGPRCPGHTKLTKAESTLHRNNASTSTNTTLVPYCHVLLLLSTE